MKQILSLLLVCGLIAPTATAAPNVPRDKIETEIAMIQENSLVGVSLPYFEPEPTAKEIALELLLEEVIRRESGGDTEICNLDYGCSSGMGLCGFITSTWNSSLGKMSEEDIVMDDYCWQIVSSTSSKNHPIYNEECHRTVCKWLLETEGIQHWEPYSGPYPKHLISTIYDN